LVLKWRKEGLTNKSINNLLGFLYSSYKYGLGYKWVKENPLELVARLPKQKRDVRFLDEEDMQNFIEVIKTFPQERFVPLYVALCTGMRISELLALEWSDIDFVRGTININKQYYKGNLATPKTYKSTRRVSVPSEVLEELKNLKEKSKVLSKIVFCGSSGKYINQNKFVKNWFKKAMKAIGKPDYNFHCLRHTYATFLIQNGVPINYVSERLGHSSPQTTLNVYNHAMPKITNQAMNLFEKIKKEHFKSIEIPERVEAQQ
jgi:integrase